jgi:hypothetical protein
LLSQHLEQLGTGNCVLVITDSASNCKSAGALIEEQYPHITWMPCTAHIVDLYLEDLGMLEPIKEVITDAKAIVMVCNKLHNSHL